jgi:23S rRNA pseudouridine1911/1915/1917 synthase
LTEDEQMMSFAVEGNESGTRLDVWLTKRVTGVSRSRLQSLIKSGHVLVNGKNASAHSGVTAGSTVTVEIPPATPVEAVPEDIPIDILYEDSHVIVLNKQPGIVVHQAAGHTSGTLVNALLHHCSDLAGVGGELRPGIVHRLDKDTSGVLVVAKNEKAMAALSQQFKDRLVKKEYTAVIHGRPKPASGTLETMIGRHSRDRKKMSACAVTGRNAITHYEVTETKGPVSVVRVRIETGRTHQIRVHMTHIGCPVVGDIQYGSAKKDKELDILVPRQMLHATILSFEHPDNGEKLEIKAPIPDDMKKLIDSF